MSLLDDIQFWKRKGIDLKKDEYSSERVGYLDIPDKLTDHNALNIANSLPEIYFPIDFHADRISKLRFYISKEGKEVEKSEFNRFFKDLNPFFSFSDLVYQTVFTYLASGNNIHYVTAPSIYNTVTARNIDRLDVLNTELTSLYEYTNISILEAKSLNSLIRRAQYTQSLPYKDLIIDNLSITNIDATRRCNSILLSKSPLFKGQKTIDLLLAVYSARYNVYVNNGYAGYLVKKGNGSSDINNIINPATRDEILKDINEKGGLTGNKRLWGISSIPLEFINTLATIKDLMPLDETLETSIKIASIYNIPSVLVPRKDLSTFDNQEIAEKNVWENTTMSLVNTVCEIFTKSLKLDVIGYSISADLSTVSALQQNETEKENTISKRLDNLKKIKEISPEKTNEVNFEIDKILNDYGTEE